MTTFSQAEEQQVLDHFDLLCSNAFRFKTSFWWHKSRICTFPAKARWRNCIYRKAVLKDCFSNRMYTSLYDITCTSFIHACMRAEQTRREGPFLSLSFLPVLCWRRPRWRRDSRHGRRTVNGSKKLSGLFRSMIHLHFSRNTLLLS